MPGIAVSLGYVTVRGYWQDLQPRLTAWRSPKVLLHTVWRMDRLASTEWK
jgi:hypothetical protein